MKKTKFIIMTMLLAVVTLATSCIGEDNKDDSIVTSAYCTIHGTNPDYTLYADGGAVLVPTAASIQEMTNGKGFENAKRACFNFRYKPNSATTNAETGITYVKDVELLQGYTIKVSEILSKMDADDAKITAADSSFAVMQLNSIWAYNGYLNTNVTGYYSGTEKTNIRPSVNLVYSPSDIKDNEITLHLYYNRHSEQSAQPQGYYSFEDSFALSDLVNVVPGSDDITINVVTDKNSYTKTQKVARKQFKFEAYPFYMTK